MATAHRVRVFGWWLGIAPSDGVRAIVVTPEGTIVLVRQTYTRGWHLPAGGCRRGEPAADAIARELREEIGLIAGTPELLEEHEARLGRRPHRVSTFVVRGARYRTRFNLEIAEAAAFPPSALPRTLAPASREAIGRWIAACSAG